jgi:hypothetical protein
MEIIASVKVGQKFCMRNGTLEIETHPSSIPVIMKRWLYNDTRATTLAHIKKLFECEFRNPTSIASVHSARMGMERLKETYKRDKKTVDAIASIVSYIDVEIKKMNPFFDTCQISCTPASPISFPPSQPCAITVSTGAKGRTLSTSLNATNEQFNVGSLPKSLRKL